MPHPSENAVQAPLMQPREAIAAARAWWATFIATPLIALAIGAVLLGPLTPEATGAGALIASAVATLWLAVAVPGAFVLRSHCFRAAWAGRPVSPEQYLRGVLTVWGTLEIAALLGVAGCLVSGGVLPCAAPAALAVAFITLLPPSERAVAR